MKFSFFRGFFLTAALLLLPGAPRAAAASEPISQTGFFFDTVVTVTLNGTADETLLEECFSMMNHYEELLSRTREGSDVWNINHSQSAPTQVSDETAFLIETGLSWAEKSEGVFDITIAPLSILWNFQENTGTIPPQEEISAALDHVDWKSVELAGNTVTLTDPEAAIDLGGIAKGYIADQLKDFLLGEGIESGLINLGGNVLSIGAKPEGTDWNIGIRKPFGGGDLITVVPVNDLSVVTSGNYERYFEKDGVIYHHILSTEDGYPIENGLNSVTILSESSMDGDALSTTCFALGMEKGMELIESLDGIEAMFVDENNEMYRTSGFPGE